MDVRGSQVRRLAAVALVLGLAGLLGGCEQGPARVALADLAAEPERYHGEQVETAGVVIEFGPEQGALAQHYVVQDADANRVELKPEEEVVPFVGRTVRVVGPFDYTETTGRVLTIDLIEPAAGGT